MLDPTFARATCKLPARAWDRRTTNRVSPLMTDAWNTGTPARPAHWAAFTLALVAILPTSGLAQASRDTVARANTPEADSSLVQLTPGRPKQGSVLRISIRPPARARTVPDSAAAARQPADTVAGGVAWTIPRPDSTRRDSLALPRLDS